MSNSPFAVVAGSSPIVTSVLFNSSTLAHGIKELHISQVIEGCRNPISVPNASIDISIPAAVLTSTPTIVTNMPNASINVSISPAIPTFTPTIVTTILETSSVNAASEVPMILPCREELFDGVAPSFLPFLHRLCHYGGNMFSGMMTQPRFLRVMNLQILGSVMQSLDEKPLESLTFKEVNGLCNGLNAVKSCQIDIYWLETGLQQARHLVEARQLVEASHVKAELSKLQQDIDKTKKLLTEMKSNHVRLTSRVEDLEKLSIATWASDSSILEDLLK